MRVDNVQNVRPVGLWNDEPRRRAADSRFDVGAKVCRTQRIDAQPDRLRVRVLQKLARKRPRFRTVLRGDGILQIENQRVGR